MEEERKVIVLSKPVLIGNKSFRDLEITVNTKFEHPRKRKNSNIYQKKALILETNLLKKNNILIITMHLLAILIFTIHHTVIEYNITPNTTRLQLGNDKSETPDTTSLRDRTISLETILVARSNILLLRWSRQWI